MKLACLFRDPTRFGPDARTPSAPPAGATAPSSAAPPPPRGCALPAAFTPFLSTSAHACLGRPVAELEDVTGLLRLAWSRRPRLVTPRLVTATSPGHGEARRPPPGHAGRGRDRAWSRRFTLTPHGPPARETFGVTIGPSHMRARVERRVGWGAAQAQGRRMPGRRDGRAAGRRGAAAAGRRGAGPQTARGAV